MYSDRCSSYGQNHIHVQRYVRQPRPGPRSCIPIYDAAIKRPTFTYRDKFHIHGQGRVHVHAYMRHHDHTSVCAALTGRVLLISSVILGSHCQCRHHLQRFVRQACPVQRYFLVLYRVRCSSDMFLFLFAVFAAAKCFCVAFFVSKR